uniref:Putative secreted protein n=1 Tax=Anopheles darlingi TaxID=43151 RepID=A0A2M4DRD9_ANODA
MQLVPVGMRTQLTTCIVLTHHCCWPSCSAAKPGPPYAYTQPPSQTASQPASQPASHLHKLGLELGLAPSTD